MKIDTQNGTFFNISLIILIIFVRREVPAVVNMGITAFWDVRPCSIVHTYQFFRGILCLQLQGRRECTFLRMKCKEEVWMVTVLVGVLRHEVGLPVCRPTESYEAAAMMNAVNNQLKAG